MPFLCHPQTGPLCPPSQQRRELGTATPPAQHGWSRGELERTRSLPCRGDPATTEPQQHRPGDIRIAKNSAVTSNFALGFVKRQNQDKRKEKVKVEHQQPWVKPRCEAGTLARVDSVPKALCDVPLTLSEAGHSLGHRWEGLTGSVSRCPPGEGPLATAHSPGSSVCSPVSREGDNHPLPSQGSSSPC